MRCKTYFILLSAILLMFSGCVRLPPPGDEYFSYPTVTPRIVYTGISTNVRVAITVGYKPEPVSDSVNLLQMKPAGSVILSRMYDDGTHGDLSAGDERFTTEINVNEPNPTDLTFQVSALFDKQERLSYPFSLSVRQFPDLEGIWNRFVDCMVKKDLEGGLEFITADAEKHYRDVFNKVGLDKVSEDFQTFQKFEFQDISYDRAKCTFYGSHRGIMSKGSVIFEQGSFYIWRIKAFGF